MRALFLVLLLSGPAAAKDPLMETLGDPAKLAEVLKERKPKTAHLEAALKAGNADAAKLLLKAGARIPSSDKAQRELLDRAIKLDGETVRLLLAAGVPVDLVPQGWKLTALTEASDCWLGRERPDVLAALLDAGASPNPTGWKSPLENAVGRICEQHIQLLLSRGAKTIAAIPWTRHSSATVRLWLDAGYKPDSRDLKSAMLWADTDTVRLLLSTRTAVLDDASYIHRALRRALFELSKPDTKLACLIADGRSISLCESDQSLIQQAALLPDATVLRYLLKHYPNSPDWVCPVDGGGPTPLVLAACKGSSESVKLLVDAGASHNALARALRDHISSDSCPLSGIKALVDAGVRVDGWLPTALYHYKTKGQEPSMELIETLLAGKPNLRQWQAPLLSALRWPQVARRFIKAGADINAVDADGKSLLHNVDIHHAHALAPMALALELGANPNAVDNIGWTPLMYAAKDGRVDSVALLLKHGADPQRVEAKGRTALQIALDGDKLEAAQLLRGVTKIAASAPSTPPRTQDPAELKKLVAQAVSEARKEEKRSPAPAAPAAPTSDVDKPGYSSPEDLDAYAVVVGVEEYSGLPKAPFAERDAAAVRRHFKALGVPDRNLVLLSGAKAVRSALAKYLESWLPKNVSERSRVYFYFSGHGAPDPASGRAYLMPWDGDPSFLADTAYPVDRLYKTLDGLKAKQVFVALDACFSGAGGRSVLPEGTRPLVTKLQKAEAGRVTVLSATQPDQITGVIKEQGHGIFTYYLLKGLSAGGTVTPQSLYSYLKPKVEDEARRQNRDQSPSLSGPGGLVLRR